MAEPFAAVAVAPLMDPRRKGSAVASLPIDTVSTSERSRPAHPIIGMCSVPELFPPFSALNRERIL